MADNDGIYVGPVTHAVLDGIIKEFKKKKTQEKIMKHVIDPVLCDISTRYYPYFLTMTVMLTIMIILLIIVLIFAIVHKH